VLPVAVFVAAAIVGVVAVPFGLVGWAAIAIVLAAYYLAVSVGRRTVAVAVPVTAVLFAAAATVIAPGWWTGLGPMALAAMLVGVALGAAVRARREAVEQQARRRIVEERLRIARDVHDLVAHHLAVITVQAGVAAHLLPEQPRAASEALEHVRAAGAAVLDELGTLLGVLRGADDPATPTEPTPSLADLGRLLDAFAAAGLRVDHTVSGSAVPLPATVEATAYRIVQESLTNASRHGTGRARLTLTYAPGGLRIEVRNGCAARRTAGTGHGLAGMRERAAMAGGTLVAGPMPGGEFVVEATLPVPREAR
jgi:signal transduction histidine kinase